MFLNSRPLELTQTLNPEWQQLQFQNPSDVSVGYQADGRGFQEVLGGLDNKKRYKNNTAENQTVSNEFGEEKADSGMAFLNSSSLDVAQAGLNAVWQQQQLHLQNLSNVSTPKYKAKSMVFEEVSDGINTTGKSYKAKIVEDQTISNRPDGNNVDADKESMELYKAYVQYSMLLNKASGELSNYSHVLNASM